jgi:NAD(P)H-dependent FMN reductase
MYTVVSGTNRPGSHTLKVASYYYQWLEDHKIPASLLSLEGLNVLVRNSDFIEIEKKQLIPAEKFIFVCPEYNGSIPGVLKAMFDISDIKKDWPGKKALLTGVSTGRAGNLRGMDDLTGVLHYLRVVVHPNKLPISQIDKLLNGSNSLDATTLSLIDQQLQEFVAF